MTADGKGDVLPAGAGRRAGFWAPALSLLCALHCAGMAVLAAWLPGVAALAGLAWIEPPLIGLSAASAFWLLWRLRAPAAVWAVVGLALGAAVWGLRSEREAVMQGGLGVSAGVQLILALAARRARAAGDPCCASDGCRPFCSPTAGLRQDDGSLVRQPVRATRSGPSD